MRELLNQIKKAVVFLGKASEKGGLQLYATGFLVNIQTIYYIVTAKHNVVDPITGKLIDSGMLVLFNLKDGGISWRPIDWIKNKFTADWVFHENKDVDITLMPFPIDPQKDDLLTIPDSMFLTSDRLFEVYDVFFLSYQPGIQPQKRISPIVRRGTISLVDDDKTFYIDGFAFPGNSGSPVFLKPSPIRFDERGISIGRDELGGKFIGVIGQYIPYQEVAVSVQTKRPRVIFEENTGLSRVWSANFIKEVTEQSSFKAQLDQMLKIKDKPFPM